MNKYEIMFIVKPTLEEEAIKKVFADIKAILNAKGGNIIAEKEMGQKDLAYEIKEQKRGYYFLIVVECTKKIIEEFVHAANVNENIIRYLTVKAEE